MFAFERFPSMLYLIFNTSSTGLGYAEILTSSLDISLIEVAFALHVINAEEESFGLLRL